jgi:hypothetical protein
MLKIFYSDQDIEVIQDERYHHPHSAIRQRMTILALHSSGVVAEHIPPLANCSKRTVLKVTVYLNLGKLSNSFHLLLF